MRYLPLSEETKKQILKQCGVSSFEELTAQVPDSLRLDRLLDIDPALSEPELLAHLKCIGSKNRAAAMTSYLGQGTYDHTWPVVIDYLSGRGEFLTAYTPYQPEVSQGTLQSIFEYQSMVASLTGFEVSNGSLYDGATAVVEAILMAARLQRKDKGKVLVAGGLFTETKKVLRTYLDPLGFELVPWTIDPETLQCTSKIETLDIKAGEVVAVLLQSPNRWGLVESWRVLKDVSEKLGAVSIAALGHVHSLGLFEAPGAFGIDIAVGDGQPLGIPVGFGGPHLGLFCCHKRDVRQMPGRLIGATKDTSGKRAFCVTLATREQHIRREKATSNICSNQSLMALRAAMYMTLMGPEGLKEVATLSHSKAVYLRSRLTELIRGRNDLFISDGEIFNEFTIFVPQTNALWIDVVLKAAEDEGIILGHPVDVPVSTGFVKGLSIAVTEKHSREDLDRVVDVVSQTLLK
ncbi:MAG TPA: aminomethyl-transferring glycine dehydrogenase subunit GcvPA [Bdellovibrionota bacterium]|nr:aminomethyl-transferring glycine dehydrogenase subunit GcvPA [Bdellovibrionota bacterium]